MTFTEWLKQYELFAYLISALVLILIITFTVRFFMLRKIGREFKKQIVVREREVSDMLNELDAKKAKVNLRPAKTIKKVKVIPEPVADTPSKSFNPKQNLKKTSFAYWRYWFIEKYFPAKCVLINMELVNGFHKLFIIIERDGGFIFRGKKYIFDDDSKYYNMDAKLYVFDYHETITLPIKRVIPVTDIKKIIESTADIDIEYAINPSTLQRFMTAKIAEGVMKGTLLDEFLRKLQMFIIVIMITVVVHFLLFVYASGILENINLPF